MNGGGTYYMSSVTLSTNIYKLVGTTNARRIKLLSNVKLSGALEWKSIPSIFGKQINRFSSDKSQSPYQLIDGSRSVYDKSLDFQNSDDSSERQWQHQWQ